MQRKCSKVVLEFFRIQLKIGSKSICDNSLYFSIYYNEQEKSVRSVNFTNRSKLWSRLLLSSQFFIDCFGSPLTYLALLLCKPKIKAPKLSSKRRKLGPIFRLQDLRLYKSQLILDLKYLKQKLFRHIIYKLDAKLLKCPLKSIFQVLLR